MPGTISFAKSRVFQFYKQRSIFPKPNSLGPEFVTFMKLDKEYTREAQALVERLRKASSLIAGRIIVANTRWSE
jgi:hypothetical protein